MIGLGGVSSADDVIEMMTAGATAVQIGAANLIDPFICRDIIRELQARMDHYGIAKISDLKGGSR